MYYFCFSQQKTNKIFSYPILVETRALNQAVKRNESRFPDDFMFRLTEEEWALDVITICDDIKGKTS